MRSGRDGRANARRSGKSSVNTIQPSEHKSPHFLAFRVPRLFICERIYPVRLSGSNIDLSTWNASS